MKCFNGLTTVNVELTSRCNKECWMCGRRKIDSEYPELRIKYGDMDFGLVKKIARQLPPGIVVQFHNNGEPLLYPRLGDAMSLFSSQTKCFNTNGKLLLEKAGEIIGKLDTLTISVVENDDESDFQYKTVKKFLKIKGDKKPFMIYRLLGDVEKESRWRGLGGLISTRILHNPLGSYQYEKQVTIPEIGICLDLLNHMAINSTGEVSICVRFDPRRLGVIGNVNNKPLVDIWNSPLRKKWIEEHKRGLRKSVPLCSKCDYYGCPTGKNRR